VGTLQFPAEAQTPARANRAWIRADSAAAWLLGFAPTVYLALSGGGYDIVARSEIGILIWWVVLLGVLVGVFPRRRLRRPAWVALVLLGGFFLWTWAAAGWSQSDERTLAEAGLVATYLGVFVVGLSVLTRSSMRWLLFGLASAIALVSALAVLSRLVPSWFPTDTTANLYAPPACATRSTTPTAWGNLPRSAFLCCCTSRPARVRSRAARWPRRPYRSCFCASR
jgi:hypothetical protein